MHSRDWKPQWDQKGIQIYLNFRSGFGFEAPEKIPLKNKVHFARVLHPKAVEPHQIKPTLHFTIILWDTHFQKKLQSTQIYNLSEAQKSESSFFGTKTRVCDWISCFQKFKPFVAIMKKNPTWMLIGAGKMILWSLWGIQRIKSQEFSVSGILRIREDDEISVSLFFLAFCVPRPPGFKSTDCCVFIPVYVWGWNYNIAPKFDWRWSITIL